MLKYTIFIYKNEISDIINTQTLVLNNITLGVRMYFIVLQ